MEHAITKTTYTVNQLAKLAGVSVRTLHYYDEIGLLEPAFTGDNGYRRYGPAEVARLQQILILRELDIPLSEIASSLHGDGADRLSMLQRQRERLQERLDLCAAMMATIDRTIASLKGEKAMNDSELFADLVSPEKQAEHEAWLEERFGPETREHIDRSRRALARMTADERTAHLRALDDIEQALARAMQLGAAAHDASLEPLIERHRAWVATNWSRPCDPDAYAGLAQVYLHPEFVARYEAIRPGFAAYLCAAMQAWARKQH